MGWMLLNISVVSGRTVKLAERIFCDTNPIIYLLDDHPVFGSIVEAFILKKVSSGCELYTSVITNAEFLCKPMANREFVKIDIYDQFIYNLGICIMPITESIAWKSAELRSKYKSLKLPDALQLAASIEQHCDLFLTNDERLMQVAEANVLCLSSLRNK